MEVKFLNFTQRGKMLVTSYCDNSHMHIVICRTTIKTKNTVNKNKKEFLRSALITYKRFLKRRNIGKLSNKQTENTSLFLYFLLS